MTSWSIFRKETTLLDKIKFYIGVYGEKVGFGAIVLVTIWDFLMVGFRGFAEWRIGTWGIVAIWLGAILISLSKHLDKNF